jgi:uncharacterized protein (DUF2062 family)
MTAALIISSRAPAQETKAIVEKATRLVAHVIVVDLPLPVRRERAGVRAPSQPEDGPHPDPLPEYRERGQEGSAPNVATALATAAELGCTHAIALDISREHSLADVPAFLESIRQYPDSIVTGVRHYPSGTLPAAVRLARHNCDFWTWAETGHWIHDSAFGYRAYPLADIADLVLRSQGCEAEVELLVKAMWMGVSVVEILLTIEQGAHRSPALLSPRQIAGFLSLTSTLMFQRLLLPAPLRATMHRREFAELPPWPRLRRILGEAVRHHCDRPSRFAACMGVGVFFGIVPIWGFQMLAAAAAAHLLRLSKPLVIAASHVSSPITLPLILYASLLVGHLLIHGQLTGLPRVGQMQRSVMLQYLGEYLLGSTVLATAAGVAAATMAYVAAAALKSVRGNV